MFFVPDTENRWVLDAPNGPVSLSGMVCSCWNAEMHGYRLESRGKKAQTTSFFSFAQSLKLESWKY